MSTHTPALSSGAYGLVPMVSGVLRRSTHAFYSGGARLRYAPLALVTLPAVCCMSAAISCIHILFWAVSTYLQAVNHRKRKPYALCLK